MSVARRRDRSAYHSAGSNDRWSHEQPSHNNPRGVTSRTTSALRSAPVASSYLNTDPCGFVGRMSRLAIDSQMKRARPQPRLLLSKQEAAISLGMSVRHFERHVQAHVRCVRSGQLTLYHLRDLEQWAEDEATINGRAA